MKELVSVVIPFTESTITPTQERLLRRSLDVLARYPILFITYEGADVRVIQDHQENADILYFPKEYFQSRQTLSRLFLMEDFYDRFSWVDFLLILELNTWVVKDELHYWCKQGYDYLNAAPVIPVGKRLPNRLSTVLGYNPEQKKILAGGFEENGLVLCHVQRMIQTLKKSQKTAYQYRHTDVPTYRDLVFWEIEANRFWLRLRKPSAIVRDFFCKSLLNNKLPLKAKNKTLPFAFTGINSTHLPSLLELEA